MRCKGCNVWITLRGDRNFDPANWIVHLRKCRQITGVELKRVSVEKPKHLKAVCSISFILKTSSDYALAILLDQPPGVQSLTAFFQPSPPALRIPKKEETTPSPKPLPESGTYITRNVDVVSQLLNLQ